MKNAIFYIVTLWGLLWVQTATHHVAGGTLLGVPWTLSAVLFLGLTCGPWVGQLLGACLGLLLDASALSLFGLHALLFAVTGYAAGMLRRQVDGTKPWTQMILSGITAFIYGIVFTGLEHLF